MTYRSPEAPERLLESALHEFALHGPGGARTRKIAARARVNLQLINYYFGNKHGLYLAALTHAGEAVAAALARLPLAGLTAVERLRRLVRGQFDFLCQHPRHAAILLGAPEREEGREQERTETGAAWADRAVRPVADLLREGQATGFFRDDLDPDAQARLTLLVILGYVATRGINRAWGDPETWRDRLAELVVRSSSW